MTDAVRGTSAETAGTTREPRQKDLAIQSLRGVAILLMVAGHVIGSTGARGLQVPDDSVWRLGYLALEDLRMPLFTAISGYVYALRPVRVRSQYPALVRGKLRRLVVPLVTVGALMFAMQRVVPGVNARPDLADAWRVYLFPFEHLWFLQAVLLIFLLIGLLDVAGRMDRVPTWGAVLAVACALHVAVRVPPGADVLSVNGALRLLPFFLLGIGLYRFRGLLDRPGLLFWSLPAFAVVYGLRLVTVLGTTEPAGPADRAIGLGVGLTGLLSVLLLRRALSSRALAWLGGFSFGVYLLHVFGAAAARMALRALGLESVPVLFVLGLVAGVGLPVLFQSTLGRHPVVSRLVLGEQAPRRRAGTLPAPVDAGVAAAGGPGDRPPAVGAAAD